MTCWLASTPTPLFEYSDTLFSKKLVLPCREILSIQSKGFVVLYFFWQLSATSNRSAQNSMYCTISFEFIPISSTGKALWTNSHSMVTALPTISNILSSGNLLASLLYIKHAKSQCMPSSREISSLENASPGMRPLFFSQNIAQKEPLKKIPSMAAKAMILSAKDDFSLLSHFSAQFAFFCTHGTVSIAFRRWVFSVASFM